MAKLYHYWVSSEEFLEAGEFYRIVDCVEARNIAEAKGKFVSIQRSRTGMDSFFSQIGSDNPFVGLEVESCMCKHGVCNCDLDTPCTLGKPQDPKWDRERQHLGEMHYALAEHKCRLDHTEEWA